MPDEETLETITHATLYFMGSVVGMVILGFCASRVRRVYIKSKSMEVVRRSDLQRQGEEAKERDDEIERRDRRLRFIHNQLEGTGVNVEDFTPLEAAKEKYRAALSRLEHGDDANAEAECERWDRVLRAHPEYRAEIEQGARAWEESQRTPNGKALREMRSFIPVNIKALSVDGLVAAGAPRVLASRLRQKRVLWLVRMHADDIAQLHTADLQNAFVAHGLDLTELRAVFAAVPAELSNDPTGEKNGWREDLRTKLRTMTTARELRPNEMRKPAYHGAKSSRGRRRLRSAKRMRQPKAVMLLLYLLTSMSLLQHVNCDDTTPHDVDEGEYDRYNYAPREAAAEACVNVGYEGLYDIADLTDHSRCSAGWLTDGCGFLMSETRVGGNCGTTGCNNWDAANAPPANIWHGAYCCISSPTPAPTPSPTAKPLPVPMWGVAMAATATRHRHDQSRAAAKPGRGGKGT